MRAARWVATALLVGLLIRLIDLHALSSSFKELDPRLVAMLAALTVAMSITQSMRLYTIVRAAVHGEPGPRPLLRRSVLGDQLVGVAGNSILPSTIGGDVVRAVLAGGYLAGNEPRARAAGLILIDRVIGLVALGFIPLVGSLAWGRPPPGGVTAIVGLLVALFVGAWQLPRILGWFARWTSKRWPRVAGFADGMRLGFDDVAPRARCIALVWSIAYQLCVLGFFELIGAYWNDGWRLHQAVWIGIPTAMVLSVVPVSIGGLGWRESLFVGAFVWAGLPQEHGLVMSVLWAASGLAQALAGAVVHVRRQLRRERPT
ncbi:MAG TPA: lysylphosphatidylglycerol synthase transmembrane domain-containing protein [Kofleriaceae bacterium]